MSITLYSKFRRQNLRRAWDFAGMTEWCVNVGLSIILFLAAIILVQYVADKAIAADDAEHKAKAESRKGRQAGRNVAFVPEQQRSVDQRPSAYLFGC